jgi:hypothetical protein
VSPSSRTACRLGTSTCWTPLAPGARSCCSCVTVACRSERSRTRPASPARRSSATCTRSGAAGGWTVRSPPGAGSVPVAEVCTRFRRGALLGPSPLPGRSARIPVCRRPIDLVHGDRLVDGVAGAARVRARPDRDHDTVRAGGPPRRGARRPGAARRALSLPHGGGTRAAGVRGLRRPAASAAHRAQRLGRDPRVPSGDRRFVVADVPDPRLAGRPAAAARGHCLGAGACRSPRGTSPSPRPPPTARPATRADARSSR